MGKAFRRRSAYYAVHALRDSTIWLAIPGRRPAKRKVDPEGVYEWRLDESEPKDFTDWAKCLRYVALVTTLNTKRIVREKIEGKLDLIIEKLDSIEQRLDRLEGRFNKP